jgi:DNA polymerase I-like protein with 3'-5' exonuclease and polymerase domains
MQKMLKQTSVCFDTETTSINPLVAELVGIAFSWETGKGFYVPFPGDRDQAQLLIEVLRPFFEFFRRNEPEALGGVKEFHGSRDHVWVFLRTST